VKHWCDVAAYLGAPVVRVFAGWVPPQRMEQDPGRIVGFMRKVFGQPVPNTRRLWSDITWTLRQCADYAAERGVVLAVQNNRADGVVGSAQQLEQCVHDVGSPWLRICLDPADLADRAGIEAAMTRVVQTHARLRDVRDDGSDAVIHWPELLRMLKLGRYRGFVLLDYEGAEEPETAVPRASRYIRGILHLLQRQQLLAAGSADGASSGNGAVIIDEDRPARVGAHTAP
jgi:sugar phosphate isomerase/epimerase